MRSEPEGSSAAALSGSRRFQFQRLVCPRGLHRVVIAEFERALDDVSVAPRSSLCAICDDVKFRLEVVASRRVACRSVAITACSWTGSPATGIVSARTSRRSRSRGSDSSAGRAPASAFIEKRSRNATDADYGDVAKAIAGLDSLRMIEAVVRPSGVSAETPPAEIRRCDRAARAGRRRPIRLSRPRGAEAGEVLIVRGLLGNSSTGTCPSQCWHLSGERRQPFTPRWVW